MLRTTKPRVGQALVILFNRAVVGVLYGEYGLFVTFSVLYYWTHINYCLSHACRNLRHHGDGHRNRNIRHIHFEEKSKRKSSRRVDRVHRSRVRHR